MSWTFTASARELQFLVVGMALGSFGVYSIRPDLQAFGWVVIWLVVSFIALAFVRGLASVDKKKDKS